MKMITEFKCLKEFNFKKNFVFNLLETTQHWWRGRMATNIGQPSEFDPQTKYIEANIERIWLFFLSKWYQSSQTGTYAIIVDR